jgi:hypothetical protein
MRTDERRSVIGKAFEKPLFNQSPSVCKIIVTGWQRPHSMQVIGQNDPGVNMEGAVFSNLPHHASEYFDTPNEQVIRVAFEQVDGEEISSACYAITSIVRHVHIGEYANDWENPGRNIFSGHSILYAWPPLDRIPCGAIRLPSIAPYAG